MNSLGGKITSKMEERVYYSKKGDTTETITNIINSFFDELVQRRRVDIFSGGLQAGLIIGEDSMAAKVNEGDGNESHIATNVNLVKFLNGDFNYITQEGMQSPVLYREDLKQLNTDYIESRIIDGKDKLTMTFVCKRIPLSKYQIDSLKVIMNAINELYNSDVYKNIRVGISIDSDVVDCNNWNNSHYDRITQVINNQENRINNHKHQTI